MQEVEGQGTSAGGILRHKDGSGCQHGCMALAVPQFAYVTALGGALFGLTVCVCIPALAFLKITWGCAVIFLCKSCWWCCSSVMPSCAACKL